MRRSINDAVALRAYFYFKALFTQKHNPGPKTHKQAQTVEEGETAALFT